MYVPVQRICNQNLNLVLLKNCMLLVFHKRTFLHKRNKFFNFMTNFENSDSQKNSNGFTLPLHPQQVST